MRKMNFIIIVIMLFCIIIILTGCAVRKTPDELLNQSVTNMEYQNNRLALDIIQQNIEDIKEAIQDGATPNDFSLDGSQYYLCNRDYPKTALGYAISYDELLNVSIKTLISCGSDINYIDQKGRTYLLTCAENSNTTGVSVYKLLLDNGADPNAATRNGDTAFDILLSNGSVDDEWIDSFISHGVKVTQKTMQYAYRNSEYISIKGMRKLADYVKKTNGSTGLSEIADAAVFGDNDKLKTLISKGIDQNDINFAVAYTAAYGTPDNLQAIINEVNIDIKTFKYGSNNLVEITSASGNLVNMKFLVKSGEGTDIKFVSVMNNAISNNDIEMVKYLLQNRAAFNSSDGEVSNNERLTVQNMNTEMIDLMLQNISPSENWYIISAAEGAISQNRLDKLQYIMKNSKSDIISTDDLNELLSYAASQNNVEAMQKLIDAGANVNEYQFDPPLFTACENRQLDAMNFLISKGATFDYGENKDGAAKLIDECIYFGYLDELNLLISKGININAEKYGINQNPVIIAARFGSKNVLQALINAGGKINTVYIGPTSQQDLLVSGDTPLHAAVRWGGRENVKALLEANADTTIKNSENMTAYDVAKQLGNKEIIKLFEEYGKH